MFAGGRRELEVFICSFEPKASLVDRECVCIMYYICNLEMPGMGLASSLSTGPESPGSRLFFCKLPPLSEAPHLMSCQSEAMSDQNPLPG